MEKQDTMADNKKGIGLWWKPLAIMGAVVALDQLTKIAIDRSCPVGWCRNVIPGLFNLVHFRNTGCAWSMLDEHTWVLAIISVAAFAAILVFFRRLNGGDRIVAYTTALLAGGIAGNMIDRVVRGSVVDFLDFFAAGHHWPAFNVADSAITISCCIIAILSLRSGKTEGDDKERKAG